MKEIQLTQGQVALVDDEDFERLDQYKWHVLFNNSNKFYALRTSSMVNGKRFKILMHREIINAPKNIQVDHRNGNGLDNRKENLRLCTNQQNQFNRISPNKNNKLRTKGVSWHKGHKRFCARIKFNSKNIHLGYFTVLADANQAYREAEKRYFGEFTRSV